MYQICDRFLRLAVYILVYNYLSKITSYTTLEFLYQCKSLSYELYSSSNKIPKKKKEIILKRQKNHSYSTYRVPVNIQVYKKWKKKVSTGSVHFYYFNYHQSNFFPVLFRKMKYNFLHHENLFCKTKLQLHANKPSVVKSHQNFCLTAIRTTVKLWIVIYQISLIQMIPVGVSSLLESSKHIQQGYLTLLFAA